MDPLLRFDTNAHGVPAASVLALPSKRWLTRELDRNDGGPQDPTSALAERCGDSALSDRRTEATGDTLEGRYQLIDRHAKPRDRGHAPVARPNRGQVNSVIDAARVSRDLRVVETSVLGAGSWRGRLAADHFHPNDHGYAAIAQTFEPTVIDAAIE